MRGFDNLSIINNIIAFNRQGIDNYHFNEPDLRYNNIFGNEDGDYTDCEPGEGSISEDPLFADFRSGDFQLTEDSPCIDAGDPDFPLDPDSTTIDLGIHYFDHVVEPPESAGKFRPVSIP